MFERVAVIGFGDFISASYVAASLANFYGEREIEIYAWDENKERCDAMCRVLRLFLKVHRIRHIVYALDSIETALSGIQGAIICNPQSASYARFVALPIFDVEVSRWWEDNPDQPVSMEAQKFQILRWINKEEYPSVFLHENRESPLVKWLNQL